MIVIPFVLVLVLKETEVAKKYSLPENLISAIVVIAFSVLFSKILLGIFYFFI